MEKADRLALSAAVTDETRGGTYYRGIDGLRGLAIALVLFEHWWTYKKVLPLSGATGVNIFFVISGFLITEILLLSRSMENPAPLARFWWRRILRIFPVYYLYLLVLLVVGAAGTRDLLPWAFTYTLNIHTVLTGDIGPRVMSHLWSLCVEEQFYFFWPLLILFAPERWVGRCIVGTAVLGTAVRITLLTSPIPWAVEAASRFTPAAFDALGIGAMLAFVRVRKPDQWDRIITMRRPLVVVLACSLLVLVTLSYSTPSWYPYVERTASALLGALLILNLMAPSPRRMLRAVFESMPLVYLGRISYGVYVYHLLVELLLRPYVTHSLKTVPYLQGSVLQYNPYLVTLPVYTAATILVASISFKYFERPVMRLKALYPGPTSLLTAIVRAGRPSGTLKRTFHD